MQRKIKVKAFDIILPLAVLILGGVLLGWVLDYDEIVMYNGIRHFRLVRNILCAGSIAGLGATVVYYIARIAGIKRELERQALVDHEMDLLRQAGFGTVKRMHRWSVSTFTVLAQK